MTSMFADAHTFRSTTASFTCRQSNLPCDAVHIFSLKMKGSGETPRHPSSTFRFLWHGINDQRRHTQRAPGEGQAERAALKSKGALLSSTAQQHRQNRACKLRRLTAAPEQQRRTSNNPLPTHNTHFAAAPHST